MTGIVGRKLGMTQIFAEGGTMVPVTVIEAKPGTVVQVKTLERDGYEAAKVGFFEDEKEKHYTKPVLGVFKKSGTRPCRLLRELPMGGLEVGQAVTLEGFAKGDKVSVGSVSKGKGFQGAMKRHNFSGGPGSHGSMFNRAVGSVGASSYPSRVWKGQRMPGHMGAGKVTVKRVEVVDVRLEQNLILLKGAVPGGRHAIVEIRKED
jgi:large subunit ribosomal protein L3